MFRVNCYLPHKLSLLILSGLYRAKSNEKQKKKIQILNHVGIYVIYFFKDGDFLLLPIPWVAISACNNIAKCLKTILRVNPELGRGDYLGVVNGCASTNSQVVVAEGLNVLALFTLLQYKPQVDSLCIEYTQMWQKCVCSKDRLAALLDRNCLIKATCRLKHLDAHR